MSVGDRFTAWAPGYERDGLSVLLADARDRALALLDVHPEDRFLDIGCATGAAVRDAARTTRLAVGVDSCPEMISNARRLAAGHPGALFTLADAGQLPFRTGLFTAVLCTSAIRHFPEPERAIAEMLRVLTGGGRLVIGDFVNKSREPGPRRNRDRPPWVSALAAQPAAAGSRRKLRLEPTGLGHYFLITLTTPRRATGVRGATQPRGQRSPRTSGAPDVMRLLFAGHAAAAA